MIWQYWLAFSVAAVVVLAFPRKCMIDVVTYAIGHGRRSAFATVTGIMLGHFCAALVILGGCMVLDAAFPFALALIQGAGLGLLLLRSLSLWRLPTAIQPIADNDNLPAERPLQVVAYLFRRTASQPDTLLLIAAFLPQFTSLAGQSPQEVLRLSLAFAALAGLTATGYAILASKIRKFLQKQRRRKASGLSRRTILIAAGSVTAGYRNIAA